MTVLPGTARGLRPDTLQVVDRDGRAHEVKARHLILAPGAVPAQPSVEGAGLPGLEAARGFRDAAIHFQSR